MTIARALAGEPTGPATQPASAPAAPIPAASEVEEFSVHGQGTVVSQHHDVFPAPYTAHMDVPRHEDWKTSVTGTLFIGARLPWAGGEFYLDPEISGGEGIGGVTGIAGFPNGEISRVTTPEPKVNMARAFLRQTFSLGGQREHIDSDQNQLAGYRDASRFTLTLGKVAAPDFFDNNAYSHDPRTQFLNEGLMENGAWDYPADTRGYAYGGAAELIEPNWALRYGVFTMPKTANGGTIDWNFPKAIGQAIELEERWSIRERPGAVRLMPWLNVAHMGNYGQAIAHPGPAGPDVTLSRTYSIKYGLGVSAEQGLTSDLGIFGRLGWNDGHTETFAFTEIDRTASVGLSMKGTRWHRPDDVAGVAVVVNGLAKDHRDYLGAGGHGFIIGDGRLPHYALEEIGEAYYLIKVYDHVFVTGDFQVVDHPAYNRDRGPIVIAGVRVHAEF
jgi:high affinity Mn2+ porin